MVSQRQKLARKKFKEANPKQFPKPEPTPPTNLKNRKKKNKLKARKEEKKGGLKNQKSIIKSTFRRIPGMKPGESCFICKAKDHIAKLCPEKSLWEKNKICLLCRRRGHSMKNCPNKGDENDDKKFCYNCGDAGHSLSTCPQPLQDGGTRFASCFICNERGHLSKNCLKNTHGIYPKTGAVSSNPFLRHGPPCGSFKCNVVKEDFLELFQPCSLGGSCKICSDITHLAKDCRNKKIKLSHAADGVGSIRAANEYDGKPRVTKFASGDDLGDDFTADDINGSNKDPTTSDSLKVQTEKNIIVKPKKQGPKVVNFLG